jgi:hypothetical protein
VRWACRRLSVAIRNSWASWKRRRRRHDFRWLRHWRSKIADKNQELVCRRNISVFEEILWYKRPVSYKTWPRWKFCSRLHITCTLVHTHICRWNWRTDFHFKQSSQLQAKVSGIFIKPAVRSPLGGEHAAKSCGATRAAPTGTWRPNKIPEIQMSRFLFDSYLILIRLLIIIRLLFDNYSIIVW